MVDTSSVAFANKGTIAVNVGGTTTGAAVLGVVKDVEITVAAEHVPLYGWGSAKRVAVAKHTMKVPVKVGYMKLDPVKTTGWQFSILNPTAADGTLLDTNTVQLFCIEGTFVFEATSVVPTAQHLHAQINNVFFPEFPLRSTEGQWMKVEMSGEGSDIIYTNTV
jgi:hypothetical protein